VEEAMVDLMAKRKGAIRKGQEASGPQLFAESAKRRKSTGTESSRR
jgi:hypothetical protein